MWKEQLFSSFVSLTYKLLFTGLYSNKYATTHISKDVFVAKSRLWLKDVFVAKSRLWLAAEFCADDSIVVDSFFFNLYGEPSMNFRRNPYHKLTAEFSDWNGQGRGFPADSIFVKARGLTLLRITIWIILLLIWAKNQEETIPVHVAAEKSIKNAAASASHRVDLFRLPTLGSLILNEQALSGMNTWMYFLSLRCMEEK